MAIRVLQRKKAHREWLIRNLTTSVILYERVTTTVAKAKEVRRWVDRMVALGKIDTLANHRRLLSWFPDHQAVKKIVEVLRERYADRPSGFTRLIPVGQRRGDSAMTMIIELVPDAKHRAEAASTDGTKTVVKPARRLPQLRKPKATITVRKKSGAKS
jgi:large subunit ribosomal protein L17